MGLNTKTESSNPNEREGSWGEGEEEQQLKDEALRPQGRCSSLSFKPQLRVADRQA